MESCMTAEGKAERAPTAAWPARFFTAGVILAIVMCLLGHKMATSARAIN